MFDLEDDGIEAIMELAGQQSLIIAPRIYADWTGGVYEALFLNQLIYWTKRSYGRQGIEDGLVVKTYQQWFEEIAVKEHSIKKATQWCIEQGFLTTELRAFGPKDTPMLHYRLDRRAFYRAYLAFIKSRRDSSTPPTGERKPVYPAPLEHSENSGNGTVEHSENSRNVPREFSECTPGIRGMYPANSRNLLTENPTEITTENTADPTPPAPQGDGGMLTLWQPEPTIPQSLPAVHEESSAAPPLLSTALQASFDRFWAAYPHKVDKKCAMKSWAKLKPSEALVERILAAVALQRQTFLWTKNNGQFVPMPSTYLNNARWEDAVAGNVTGHQQAVQRFEQAVMGGGYVDVSRV